MRNHLFGPHPGEPARRIPPPGPSSRPATARGPPMSDMLERSAAYASALKALGVKTGDRVAVAGREERRSGVPLSRRGSGGRRLPAAQHRPTRPPRSRISSRMPRRPCSSAIPPGSLPWNPVAAEAKVSSLRTLDGAGRGTMAEAADAAGIDFADVERGPDDLAAILYTLRHDRALEGRHAQPRQPRLPTPSPWWRPGVSPPTMC